MSDRIWVSVKDRLPTEQDIKENNNDDLFWVTAIYGENGIAQKIVFPCNYNRFTKNWESCDTEVVTHWMPKSVPDPAED